MLKLSDIYRGLTDTVRDPFPVVSSGLPAVAETRVVELGDGDRFELDGGRVRAWLGKVEGNLLAYNGSIPEVRA